MLHAREAPAGAGGRAREARAHVPSWGVYTGTLASLADMLTTLPLVQDLRDEAMRDRHCAADAHLRQELRDGRQVALRDLLRLQLHHFAEAVGDIVEQARQELKIDRQLTKIETVGGLALEYLPFKATGVSVLVEASLGPVIEALDEHEAALQAISGNRFVAFESVASWRTRLGGVRSTLDAWVEAAVVLARGDLHRLGGHPRAAARGREALRRHRRVVQGADGGRLADAQPARRVPQGRPRRGL